MQRRFRNRLVALAALAITGCAASHGTSPKGLELPIEKAAVKFAADTRADSYKVVTTAELKQWLDDNKPLTIISALPVEEDTQFGKLPGAVNGAIPKTEAEVTPADKDRIIAAAGSDKARTLVVYCGFVACRRSHIGAVILSEAGYTNVVRYPGGVTGWDEAGYSLIK